MTEISNVVENIEPEDEGAIGGVFRYGAIRWAVVLLSGQIVFFHAATVDVTDAGALYAIGQFRSHENEEPGEMECVFCVAPGQWITFSQVGYSDNIPLAVVTE